jgi:hypothetical protein
MASKAWSLLVAGYSIAAIALVAFLTLNGEPTPTPVLLILASLVTAGLVFPALGMFLQSRAESRRGFVLQGFGLLGLYVGIILVVEVNTPSAFFASAAMVVASAAASLAGVILLGRDRWSIGYLVLGTMLIFLGVGVIVASDAALNYLISGIMSTVYVDVGATVTACGAVIAAYSFFTSRDHFR